VLRRAFAIVVCGVYAAPAQALDGRVDLRGYRQGGRAGTLSYTTENVWENYTLEQRFQFARSTTLQARYVYRRDHLWSRSELGTSSTRRDTHVPFVTLSYHREGFRAGVSTTGTRRDSWFAGPGDRRDENLTTSFWSRYERGPAEYHLRYMDTRTRRELNNGTRKNNNSDLGFVANIDLTTNDQLRYSLNHTVNDQVTLGTETRYLSNTVDYRGYHHFDENRGRFNITTRVSRFDQTNSFRTERARRYVSPIWGGMALDDTPERLDPLETDPVPEPLLYDNDLETPTLINIGDSAPAVREFGGDYRNIIIDLGTSTAIDSVTLHVSSPIDFPALIQWEVYATDDPEGREWGTPLGPGTVTVSYQEWELGRQGWEFRFDTPITRRRIKLVDRKSGVTEADILVTEMEVFSPAVNNGREETSSALTRYRLYGDVRYNLRPNLEVNYSTDVYEHRRDDDRPDLSGAVHQAGSVWRPGKWEANGYYQISTLTSSSNSDTDAHSQFLSVMRRFVHDVDARVSWKRIDDNSPNLGYTTHDVNLDVNWYIAPGLSVNQKVGHGRRSDHESDLDARSWLAVTTIRSDPVRTLSVDLRHADRWVDQDAGSGFTSFSDTELVTRWVIVPLVNYEGQLVYRVRDESDWTARNQLSWNPLPGGAVGMSFSISDYRDTRVDLAQQSVGAQIRWRVRSNTRMEFGAEYLEIEQQGERNRPHNLYARGSMNF
jgi:hypothetical protein